MKNLETLIQELCPDGVEFVKLGDVCEIKGRIGFRGYTRKDLVSESEGAITLSPSNIINGNIVYDKCSYISWAKYEESPEIMAEVGDVVFTKTASVGKTAYIENMPKEMTINPQLVLLKKFRGVSKYLAYILKTTYFQNEVKKITGVGSVPNVPQSSLAKIEIPLPPIEVQTEIVRILDKFTSLEAELKAELDCRKRQYEYYRDKLLSFENVGGQEVEWKKMSEVGTFIRGNGLQKKDFTESGVGCIHYGQIYTKFNTFTDKTLTYCSENVARKLTPVHPGDLIIACTSENVEDVCKTVAWLGKEDIVTGGHACVFSHHENPKYIAYLLQTENFFQQKKKYARGVKVIDIKVADLQKITLPIPSLEEQHRIVSILDRFESLTTSLQSGLPAEIVARRQQYEHYRDKLLTFKRKGAA